MTDAPAAARRTAIARPWRRAAPATSATRPARSSLCGWAVSIAVRVAAVGATARVGAFGRTTCEAAAAPPSTGKVAPLMYDASSDSRKHRGGGDLSGWPIKPRW